MAQSSITPKDERIEGELILPKLDGVEIRPGVVILGEPVPIPGTDKLSALANVVGCLCRIELKITFKGEQG